MSLLLRSCQHSHDEAYQHLFGFWIGFGHQQRERGQADVVDHRFAVLEQTMVAMQEVDKHERADAFVSVTEGAILDDEIQQVRGLRFQRRIGRFAKRALVEITGNRGESVSRTCPNNTVASPSAIRFCLTR